MSRIFFDIETYSPHDDGPRLDDKIISIAFKTEDSGITVVKEWELGEKEVISQFLQYVEGFLKPNLVGHNILRFDIPVIVCRSFETGLGKPGEIFVVFREPYVIDLLQCLLPSNNLYFRGLGLQNCAERLGFAVSGCPSSQIKEHYEEGAYDEVVDHNKEDVLIIEKLYSHLLQSSYSPFR